MSKLKKHQSKAESVDDKALARPHLIVGWSTLFVFATLGMVLEGLHAFKSGYYLDLSNETRRLMWTLAHSHGTLISLVHIAFAMTQPYAFGPRRLKIASRSLYAAIILMPLGFFLGGLDLHGGDPGLGIALVPAGGFLLLVATSLTATTIRGKNKA